MSLSSILQFFFMCAWGILPFQTWANADSLQVGSPAPLFETQTHEGKPFQLLNQKGKWTVLYFYPKAETPGCTKQACAYRDSMKDIEAIGATVYGISTDTVDAQKKFHTHHRLTFTLLADPDAKITESYGAKMPVLKMAKRWTFIIDPELTIRAIDQDVDPVQDAKRVRETILKLSEKKAGAK